MNQNKLDVFVIMEYVLYNGSYTPWDKKRKKKRKKEDDEEKKEKY